MLWVSLFRLLRGWPGDGGSRGMAAFFGWGWDGGYRGMTYSSPKECTDPLPLILPLLILFSATPLSQAIAPPASTHSADITNSDPETKNKVCHPG